MKWKFLNNAFALNAFLAFLPFVSSSAGNCPNVCACKWKGGKQTVECLDRALITVPEDIDGETQVLDMSGNNLQIIPRETFHRANLTNLQRVYLRNCRIGQIGDRAFRGLTNLIELDLSQNLLTAVPSATFEDTPFLRYLSIANNPIQKIESNAFAAVLGVAKVDLSHCEIQVVSPNAFEKLESLEWLKLNGNKLTELNPRTVDAIGNLHGIELHDNPWMCDCKLRHVKQWLSRYNVPLPVAPICRRPERLFGRTFAELGIDEFACKPEMLPASRYVEATTGRNATISCRVAATPSANVHWYWNGRLLLNDSAFSAFQKVFIVEVGGSFEKTSSLILTNVLESDSGEFYCVAENRAGTTEANFTLNVSPGTGGMSSLGSGQIAGLGFALLVLVLAIFATASVILLRFRRSPVSESKIPSRPEVVVTMNGNGVASAATATKTATKIGLGSAESENVHSTNPLRKPPRKNESDDNVDRRLPARSPTGNNPDVVRDAGSRAIPNAFPKGSDSADPEPWLRRHRDGVGFYRPNAKLEYPPDYGLPMVDPRRIDESGTFVPSDSTRLRADPKTLRAWQKGIPVLPPATALKRVLANSRNSPDEGYQEGCGTDV